MSHICGLLSGHLAVTALQWTLEAMMLLFCLFVCAVVIGSLTYSHPVSCPPSAAFMKTDKTLLLELRFQEITAECFLEKSVSVNRNTLWQQTLHVTGETSSGQHLCGTTSAED